MLLFTSEKKHNFFYFPEFWKWEKKAFGSKNWVAIVGGDRRAWGGSTPQMFSKPASKFFWNDWKNLISDIVILCTTKNGELLIFKGQKCRWMHFFVDFSHFILPTNLFASASLGQDQLVQCTNMIFFFENENKRLHPLLPNVNLSLTMIGQKKTSESGIFLCLERQRT